MLSRVVFRKLPEGYYEETKYIQILFNCGLSKLHTEITELLYPNQGENVNHARHADMMTKKG